MERRFNPFDPLGILEPVRRDVDRFVSKASLPLPPGPPGLARRTEEERVARHGGPTPERGTGFARLLDPLGLFSRGSNPLKGIGNPIPAEFDGKLVDMRDEARRRLIDAGYNTTVVDRALNWHDEWLMGLVRMMAPNDMNMQRTLVQKAYSEVAPRAEKWIRGIQDAFGVPATV